MCCINLLATTSHTQPLSMDIWVYKVQKFPNRFNPKRTSMSHIIFEILKILKERILKATQHKQGNYHKTIMDFQQKPFRPTESQITHLTIERKNCQSGIIYLTKLSFR